MKMIKKMRIWRQAGSRETRRRGVESGAKVGRLGDFKMVGGR